MILLKLVGSRNNEADEAVKTYNCSSEQRGPYRQQQDDWLTMKCVAEILDKRDELKRAADSTRELQQGNDELELHII